MDAAQEKYLQMTQQPVEKLVCRLAVPSILSMMVSAFYNMADTFFIGKISTQATGAVGVVFSYMALIQAIGFFFGHGSGNYISRALGRRRRGPAAVMAANGFFFCLGCGFVIMAGVFLFMGPMLRALGATETILPEARGLFPLDPAGQPGDDGHLCAEQPDAAAGQRPPGHDRGDERGGTEHLAGPPAHLWF